MTTTTGIFTGIVTVLTPCVATTTTASAIINRLLYTIEAKFTAAEELEEEEVVFSVASFATLLGCDPKWRQQQRMW
ncbi:hypothetical protein H5410_060765 [Solanum commersonii]|uniref:Uncharacterized protein n=1 Tax=Solanum commersonii TaxID=4109 RepID=A0A9J5W6M7_SOLCO|nr:hypothetical protein H5410_060765 [Solanum commersonii]